MPFFQQLVSLIHSLIIEICFSIPRIGKAHVGQTVFHFHCHVIPRYKGDMKDPRGGVRHSVEGKGYY